jgi:hypothetical protein
MSHTIKIPLTKPKEQLLRDAAELLPENGVTFTPQGTEGGRFEGQGFAGTVHFVGDELEVEILKKPMLIPWGVVESQIRKYFAR